MGNHGLVWLPPCSEVQLLREGLSGYCLLIPYSKIAAVLYDQSHYTGMSFTLIIFHNQINQFSIKLSYYKTKDYSPDF